MRLLRSEEGVAVTEMAFMLPVVILFLMAILEGGRVLSMWMVLTNSTREAVRYTVAGQRQAAAQAGCTTSGSIDWTCVRTAVTATAQSREQAIVSSMLDTTVLTVTPSYTNDATGAPAALTINATYPVHTLTPVVHAIVSTFNVSTSATMRIE